MANYSRALTVVLALSFAVSSGGFRLRPKGRQNIVSGFGPGIEEPSLVQEEDIAGEEVPGMQYEDKSIAWLHEEKETVGGKHRVKHDTEGPAFAEDENDDEGEEAEENEDEEGASSFDVENGDVEGDEEDEDDEYKDDEVEEADKKRAIKREADKKRAVTILIACLQGSGRCGNEIGSVDRQCGRDRQCRSAVYYRLYAVKRLGEIGSVDAIPALIAAQHEDGSWQVRLDAAKALGKIGSAEAVPALFAALRDCKNRCYAAQAVGKMDGVEALPSLLAVLDKETDMYREAVEILIAALHAQE